MIDFRHFTAAKNQFEANPGLCNLFKFLAIESWKRIEFTYLKPGVKLFETTITQNISFTINAYKEVYPLPIEIFESRDEKSNGNDMEIILRFLDVDLYFAVQAKKIYRDGKYHAMEHGNQIEALIEYAEDVNAIPVYLLYNYVETPPADIHPDNELYGCSIVDAFHLFTNYYNRRIKKKRDKTTELAWLKPDFEMLHPSHAIPWHRIVCDSDNPITLLNKINKIMDPDQQLKFEDVIKTGKIDFKEIKKTPGIIQKGQIDNSKWTLSTEKVFDDQMSFLDDQEKTSGKSEFLPRLRFVLDKTLA